MVDTRIEDFDLVFADQPEDWGAALREIYAGWKPQKAEAEKILETLGVETLLKVSPLLAQRALEAARLPGEIWQTALALAGCKSPEDLDRKLSELAQSAAAELRGVDPSFIEKMSGRLLGRPTGPDRRNFQLANRVAPFRLYFFLRYIQWKSNPQARKR